jgi:MFS family permease
MNSSPNSALNAAGASRKRVIRLYYWFQFTFTLLFWIPVFFEYQKRMGLSDSQIFRIQSIYYAVFCLLELPTGYFADRFGYVRSMMLGSATLVIANLVAVYVTTFSGFTVHWLLIALARSFVSGAASAYLFEYLRRANAHADFKQIEGNARAYSLAGRIFCFGTIGFLMAWHVTLPYWLSAGAAFLSLGFAALLPRFGNEARRGTVAEVREIAALAAPDTAPAKPRRLSMRAGFRLAAGSPWLVALMCQGVVIFVLDRLISVNLFQPILHEKGFGLPAYGLMMGMMSAFEAVGSARPAWMRKKFTDIHSVFILSVVMGVSVALIPVFGQLGTGVLLAVFSVAAGLSYPIQRQVMNEAIPDPQYRATILSMESLIDRAATAMVAFVLEKIPDETNGFLIGVGVICFAVMVVVQIALSRLGRKRAPSAISR